MQLGSLLDQTVSDDAPKQSVPGTDSESGSHTDAFIRHLPLLSAIELQRHIWMRALNSMIDNMDIQGEFPST